MTKTAQNTKNLVVVSMFFLSATVAIGCGYSIDGEGFVTKSGVLVQTDKGTVQSWVTERELEEWNHRAGYVWNEYYGSTGDIRSFQNEIMPLIEGVFVRFVTNEHVVCGPYGFSSGCAYRQPRGNSIKIATGQHYRDSDPVYWRRIIKNIYIHEISHHFAHELGIPSEQHHGLVFKDLGIYPDGWM